MVLYILHYLSWMLFCSIITTFIEASILTTKENEFYNYEGDVSYDNHTHTISTFDLSYSMTKIRCAWRCLNDLQCYAVELCSTANGEECRLSKGCKATGDIISGPTCRRFQMVIQRRLDGSENFYRNWTDYEFGFGNLESEFWLGNKYIHQLTANGHTILRIELEDHGGNTRYAEYSSFTVEDASDNYRIQVSGYSGNAGDSFAGTCSICNNGMPFSTYDRENDNHSTLNCAKWGKGGWWHNACHKTNLNGLYGNNGYGQGVNWENWKTLSYSLKSSTMKLRKP
ncbi:fibrinogen-like protein 1 [Saccostrea echinata]|uniref:fibrinogen-like protein 1 n=1 Tax=Saccostrea echinata TaxID=191078 RepID=UPI002A840A49|nr:fibrinogen-like protein 1 [Saccostrea echinata]